MGEQRIPNINGLKCTLIKIALHVELVIDFLGCCAVIMCVVKAQLQFICSSFDDFCLVSSSFSPQFNTVDGTVDRTSFEGIYKVEDRKPL